jgi:hypothetical protein
MDTLPAAGNAARRTEAGGKFADLPWDPARLWQIMRSNALPGVERMEPQPTRPSAFAPLCPSCHEHCGRPRSVTVQTKQRIVQYLCDRCEHQWEMTTEAPAGLLFAEPPG